jgi:hypothetical protein
MSHRSEPRLLFFIVVNFIIVIIIQLIWANSYEKAFAAKEDTRGQKPRAVVADGSMAYAAGGDYRICTFTKMDTPSKKLPKFLAGRLPPDVCGEPWKTPIVL